MQICKYSSGKNIYWFEFSMGNWDDIDELSSVYINKVIYPDSNLNEDESASEDESPEEFEMPKSVYITSVN